VQANPEAKLTTGSTGTNRPFPALLWPLLIYLAAVIIFGKGPTYLGVWPVFWGEVVLAAVVTWVFWRMYIEHTPIRAMLTSGGSAVLAYMCLGAVLTVIGYRRWGIDALRDAAIWYCGAFFFVGLFIARRRVYADILWNRLQIVWLLALVWTVANAVSGGWLVQLGPEVAARDVPFLAGSGSENVQNMMLGAMLVILGAPMLKRAGWFYWVFPLLVLVGIGYFIIVPGRGARLAIAGGILVVFVATMRSQPPIFPKNRLLMGGLLAVMGLVGLSLAVGGGRLASMAHLERFQQIAGAEVSGTAYWRLIWWHNIVAAVHEHNPIFGLGLGADLAALNPFVANEGPWPLRSPHNFNMTVLGRMGYAGLALWGIILIGGLGRLFLRLRRGGYAGHRYTPERQKELAFWLMMLTATWINASFGVLMEGPVLGIPFWFCLGFAVERSAGSDGVESTKNGAANGVRAHEDSSRG
jgi:hypothetical protein